MFEFSNRHNQYQILILLSAIILRLPILWGVYQQTSLAPSIYDSLMVNTSDSVEYLQLAENMVLVGEYSSDKNAPYTPHLKRVPGYPVILSILYIMAGTKHSILLILGFNLIASLLSLWLVLQISEKLFDKQVSLVAGIIYAFAPISAMMVSQALTETIFTTLLLVAVYILIHINYENLPNTILLALGLSVCLVTATYVRAIALYCLPIMLFILLIKQRWHRYFLVVIGVCSIVFISLLLPWYNHNYQTFGKWTFSSVADGNLMTYNAASVYAYREAIGLREAKDHMIDLLNERLANVPANTLNEASFNAYRRDVAMDILTDNILLTIWVHILDSAQTLRPGYSMMNIILDDDAETFGNSTNTGSLPNISQLSPLQIIVFGYMTIYYGLLYLLVFIGGIRLLLRRQWYLITLLFGLAYWFAFIPSIAGNSRFRVPIEGFMAISAAIGLLFILQRIRNEVSFHPSY